MLARQFLPLGFETRVSLEREERSGNSPALSIVAYVPDFPVYGTLAMAIFD